MGKSSKGLACLIVLGTAIGNGVYGSDTGKVSREYTLRASPASWTFGIWGFIYAGLIVTAFVEPDWSKSQLALLAASGVCNLGWLVAWNKRKIAASSLILPMVCTLVWMLVARSRTKTGKQLLAVYASWTTVASLLNAGVVARYRAGVSDDLVSTGIIVALTAALLGATSARGRAVPLSAFAVGAWASAGVVSAGFTPAAIPLVLSVAGAVL